MLDLPAVPAPLLAANFRDIERVNRWLGGSWLTVRAIRSLLDEPARPLTRPLTLLDVGTGSGDIPREVRRWGMRRGLSIVCIGCDAGVAVLRATAAGERLLPVVADGRALPFRDGCADIAHCSLVLHHLQPPAAVALLRELGRTARLGVVVNDLLRGRAGYLGSLALSRLTTRNPLTRHDAPLSVRRAYTLAELRALLRAAGLVEVRCHSLIGYRVAIAARSAP